MITPGVSKHFLLDSLQALAGQEVYLALLDATASYDPNTPTFDGVGEVRARGYATGGKLLTGFRCGLDGGTAWCTWNNPEWQNASIRAHGAVIYVKSKGNRILTAVPFDEEKISTQGLFRVRMPLPGPEGAVIWLT